MQAADIALLLASILLSCSGIVLYILLASSSFRSWHKDGFQSSQDLIVFFMGLSCTCFSSFQFSVDMSSYRWKYVFQSLNVCLIGINSTHTATIFFSLSMTAWLCLFYCLNIVSPHHRLLVAIKSRMLVFLPHLIAGTFLVSSILLVLLYCVIVVSVPMEIGDNSTTSCHTINETFRDNVRFINNMFNLIIAGPFLVILLSLGTTVTSLVRHVRRVHLSLQNSNVKAHLNAVKIMTLLLLLNVAFYVSFLVLNWRLVTETYILSWMFVIIYYTFWPLQALTLLFRNPKSTSVAFCYFCRCFF